MSKSDRRPLTFVAGSDPFVPGVGEYGDEKVERDRVSDSLCTLSGLGVSPVTGAIRYSMNKSDSRSLSSSGSTSFS